MRIAFARQVTLALAALLPAAPAAFPQNAAPTATDPDVLALARELEKAIREGDAAAFDHEWMKGRAKTAE